MEQKRRTITTQKTSKKKDKKKVLTILGVILGFAIIFAVSYSITYGLISSDDKAETPKATSSSTEEDIANMSRADLEESYLKLKKQLEEKEEEIEMLKERLDGYEDTPSTAAPSTTTTPTQDDNDDEPEPSSTPASSPQPSHEPEAPSAQSPAPTQTQQPAPPSEFPGDELMSPDELDDLVGATE